MTERNLQDQLKRWWSSQPRIYEWQNEDIGPISYTVRVDEHVYYRAGMARNWQGAWCGYAEIPKDHALYGADSMSLIRLSPDMVNDINNSIIKRDRLPIIDLFIHSMSKREENVWPVSIACMVHGGITWCKDYMPSDSGDKSGWWFGFDCSHCDDFLPAYIHDEAWASIRAYSQDDIYRTQQYVREDVEKLAMTLYSLRNVERVAQPQEQPQVEEK
jgi:hypothetical protein